MRNNNSNSSLPMFPVIVIAGPTATGKSDLAVALAKEIGGEIISADSMQVYRGMDIGSAKITPEEMQGIPHHLIDVADPHEPFDVMTYQQLARTKILEISSRGRIPILVGGTGFYIQAVLYDVDFTGPGSDEVFRQKQAQFAKENGAEALHQKLSHLDPEAAAQIHPNNVKRVIRAMEFYHQTGQKISSHNETQRKRSSPYQVIFFALTDDRSALYERIDRRVDCMMEQGLEDEVKRLSASGCVKTMQSMQGIGYKELLSYLDGECTKEEAIAEIKLGSRHYAKRQLTWFKRERDVIWLDRGSYPRTEELFADLLRMVRQRLTETRNDARIDV